MTSVLINLICGVHFRNKGGNINYLPNFGVEINGKIFIDDWDKLKNELNLGSLEDNDEIIENIKHNWNDFQKDQLTKAMCFSTLLKKKLELHHLEVSDLIRWIDNDT